MTHRISTGLLELDEALGGGLLPGTLTLIAGATGVGKTQFGMHFSPPIQSAVGPLEPLLTFPAAATRRTTMATHSGCSIAN